MSIMNELWDAITLRVQQLSLTDPDTGAVIPVYKRKLSRTEVGLNPATQIVVFRPEQPEKSKNAAFGGTIFYDYNFVVAITYPGNQDLLSNIPDYSVQRDVIKNMFPLYLASADYPIFGVEGVFDVRVDMDVFLPRSMIALNYDYAAVGASFKCTG